MTQPGPGGQWSPPGGSAQPPYGAPPQQPYPPYGAPQQYAPQQQGYAPQQGYGPQQGFAPQQYAQPGYAQPYPQQDTYGTGPQCRFCGCVPAADTTFRGHRGMLVIMQFRHVRGPFCRDCGLATFRKMTADTLIQGWYGYISFVVTPVTVLINLARRGKVANLPVPMPPPSGQHSRPMDPGPALLARPTALIGLAIPFVLFLVLIVLAAAGGSS